LSAGKTKKKSAAKPRASKGDDAELAEVLGTLVDAAKAAREAAYAPYSKFTVGAAILSSSGNIYTGCNVENASFGATICAERAAISAMIVAGDREPLVCTIVSGRKDPAPPCGICRQVLAEFGPSLKLVLVGDPPKGEGDVKAHALDRIFPEQFRL
jgi:cytidine deaminase